jgi:cytochrome c-type biogenesis protein CcmE
MKPRHKRFAFIGLGLVVLGIATVLITQVVSGEAPQGRSFRIGGMVEDGSVVRENDGLTVRFVVTDTAKRVPVTYKGILPDLFKEGKGAVAQGKLNADGTFVASEVLAKHDENYMPPEAAEALAKAKASGAQQSKSLVVPQGKKESL